MAKTTSTRSALNPYKTGGRSFYEARRPSINVPQRRATMDPSLFKEKKAATGAPLASRPIEGGPALPSPQEYNPIIDAESGEDPNAPRVETQQPIPQQGGSARYMIQGGGPRIDLSFLVPERANPSYDPSKAIGGENVPYKPAGLFRRFLGDESNKMNIEAQQAQGAEWREAEKEAQKEERLLARMREADKPTQTRFEASQQAAKETEAARVAAENKRLELEGRRIGLTERQIDEARQDRIARLQAEKEDRDIRIEDMRTRNALADAAFGRSTLPTAQAISTGQGGVLMYDPRSGQPLGTYSSPTIGQITDPKTGEKSFGPVGGGYEPYKPKAKAPVSTGGAQVDRATGATLGGGSTAPETGVTPAAPAPVNTALFPTMGRAVGEATGEAVSTVTDPLRAIGTDVYKALFSSGAQQDPEVLKRIKEREERRAAAPPRFGIPATQFGRGF